MKFVIHPDYVPYKDAVIEKINNFYQGGQIVGDGKRNVIKAFDVKGLALNVKSFKVPNLINKVVYRYFRKSKAERSYLYALELIAKGIGTPQPIAYAELSSIFGMGRTFYISEHLVTELTYRDLTLDPSYPDSENILKQFTHFCFELHEKGIEFLDHSPGNTLIKKVSPDVYSFYLVDLNRMNFHNRPLTFEERMVNMRRLTHVQAMMEIMSREYALLYNKEYSEVLEKLVYHVNSFQEAFQRKKRLKKKLKFWKRNK